ncbi:MAG: sigma-70 family RNA polymerase sigma factor [Limisphaerales bacterium]
MKGIMEPRRTGLYGHSENALRLDLPCSPCLKSHCTYEMPDECLKAISPATVFEHVQNNFHHPQCKRTCVFSANDVTFAPVTTSNQTDPGSTSAGAEPSPRPAFVTTHWSLVVSAGRNDTTHARNALEKLCRAYWFPIYAFVRRQGHGPHDAQDLTQEFFARLLEKNYLAGADPAKGRFRSFLLASLKHFLANEWDKTKAQKRGGGQVMIPMDIKRAENSGGFEPADNLTAENIFERRWALTLLEQVLRRLRAEYVRDGREKLFEQLKPTLTETSRTVGYAEIATRLGTTEGAVKVAVHRLRQRYREVLRAEIADTVASPGEVEDEIRNLFAALAGG